MATERRKSWEGRDSACMIKQSSGLSNATMSRTNLAEFPQARSIQPVNCGKKWEQQSGAQIGGLLGMGIEYAFLVKLVGEARI